MILFYFIIIFAIVLYFFKKEKRIDIDVDIYQFLLIVASVGSYLFSSSYFASASIVTCLSIGFISLKLHQ